MRTKITADHLERTALVYVRQSTAGQVRITRRAGGANMASSTSRGTWASIGSRRSTTIWASRAVASPSGRVSAIADDRRPGTAGAVLALEASRLARNDRDWSQFVELGAITQRRADRSRRHL